MKNMVDDGYTDSATEGKRHEWYWRYLRKLLSVPVLTAAQCKVVGVAASRYLATYFSTPAEVYDRAPYKGISLVGQSEGFYKWCGITLLGMVIGMAGIANAGASDYPVKPVRVVIPSAPGGGTDVVARVLAPYLSKLWGQTVVVENVSGGATSIGTNAVAKAASDGYMLLMTGVNFTFVPAVRTKLPYNAATDFTPIMSLTEQASLILVHPSMPVNSLQNLIALAKARPGEIRYGSGGPGTVIHFSTELLRLAAGIELLHVPYRGAGPATAAVLSGEAQMLITTAAAALAHVKSGRLRALAWTGAQRARALPDLPTAREAGLPDYTFDNWYGLWGPARMAPAVVQAINDAFNAALGISEVRARLETLGVEPLGGTADKFASYVAAELARWQKVALVAGIRSD